MDTQKIIVLGGGTAGLIAALVIKQTFPSIALSVIESNNIGIIGVGEGTTPNWPQFMRYCNLNARELITETDATFKVGIDFENWNGDGKSYIHSLVSPFSETYESIQYPALYASIISSGEDANSMIPSFLLAGRLPADQRELVDLQYHFNTHKLNDYLHKVCKQRDITFIEAEISDVQVNAAGIQALKDLAGTEYTADLFIDASGFKRVLSSKLGSQWIDYSKYLPMNHAIAFPTEATDEPIPIFTKSVALSSGWAWRIPTYGRYGNGYVFNDNYITVEQAKAEIEAHYGHEIEIGRDIKFAAGKIDKFWIKNCVSVGLASSFVEPLEASSIGFSIEQSMALVAMLSSWEANQTTTCNTYNKIMDDSVDNIVSMVQMHYITKRKDSPFWQDLNLTLTDFNQTTIEMFKKSLPNDSMFGYGKHRMFSSQNWINVMHGQEMFDQTSIANELAKFPALAEFANETITEQRAFHSVKQTISHRDTINRIRL
jgi:tryptophan halogenase